MSIMVSDLLKLPVLKSGGTLLTDWGGCNKVQYVTVMEAPDFHFEGLNHVFILTTLSAHHSSLENINTIIQGLCEAKIAAIGIKLGRFIDTVDPSTIAIAEKYQVPIIALGKDVLFREALSQMLSVIADNQRLIINQINDMNREMFDAILQNSSIEKLLKSLCGKIQCYCCCTDTLGKKIAEACSAGYSLDKNAVQDIIAHHLRQNKNLSRHVKEGNTILFPCRAQDQLLGVFSITTAEHDSELALPLSEIIVSALSLKFMEQSMKAQAKREMTASLLDEILFTKHTSQEAIADRLSLLDFNPGEQHIMVLLSLSDYDFRKQLWNTLDSVHSVFSQEFEAALVFQRMNEFVALLSFQGSKTEDYVQKRLSRCSERIKEFLQTKGAIGSSPIVEDLCLIPQCYQQAKKAIRFGKMLNPEAPVYLYSDYFEMGLISQAIHTSEAETLVKRVIEPIRRHDRQYKSELWSTLEYCFKQETLNAAADMLFIHISTLRYRLQKIQDLTGYNYFENKGRLSLYLAFMLNKVTASLEQ